ncbi:hypothetical protein HELRODRAFT_181405 [Helobdella robusta]|uniref:PAP-associated domain-containing protein n=1 Tax=Helobdella robusta TaxID=6412 RepID=T1FGZ1_HELRO|nr:hypothetical protein HELRODRAFT_181405 [Helobdella robusta]ESN92529.1 hypothetical protein HELRODRAFT_181405 [Helobdella robusta]
MSDYMYRACHHHKHILPLIFTIRQWAKSHEITRSNPGPWLSNFMLTLLVVFHLQRHSSRLLPPLKHLDDNCNDNNNNKGNVKKGSSDVSLETLLLDFFKFYSEFDFIRRGISVYEGNFTDRSAEELLSTEQTSGSDLTQSTATDDADLSGSNILSPFSTSSAPLKYSPLFLENPTERELNAAKNVLEPNLMHFKSSCLQAHKILASSQSSSCLLCILSVNDVNADKNDNDDYNGFNASSDGGDSGNSFIFQESKNESIEIKPK